MNFKYKNYLSNIKNCPPEDYAPTNRVGFRWVHQEPNEQDFIPLNLIKEPPQRVLDDSDLNCMGFGLSFFDSKANASGKFLSQLNRLRNHLKQGFLLEKGDAIAEIQLHERSGVANLPAPQNYGHFTLHEAEDSNLKSLVVQITMIL